MNTHCRLCGQRLPAAPLFELNGMPAGAQYYPTPGEFAADTGVTLRLFACGACDLYQLDSEPVPYFKDVIRPSGFSRTMIDFRRQQFTELVHRFELTGKKVFECGCGQGEFLDLWRDFPVEAHGIEHGADFVARARARGLTVQAGYLGSAADRLARGPFAAFTSFNFLEHQPDPNGMLQGISQNLTDDAAGLITVPNFDHILQNNAYYELIIDHLLYFTRKTFTAILERNGFQIIRFDDTLEDTLCAFVKKQTPVDHTNLGRCRTQLDTAVAGFVRTHQTYGGQIAVWGASHQGFTLLSSAGITESVAFIVDSSPYKHGKFAPVSHLKIVPPDELTRTPIAAILVIAPNYSEEIFRTIRDRYGLRCPVALIRKGALEVRA